jgi:hypothetical protein
MVQAIINIEKDANKVLNIVKAKYGLKDKSQAINQMAREYEEFLLGPELKPSYIEKIRKIEKEETVSFKSVADMRKHFENV